MRRALALIAALALVPAYAGAQKVADTVTLSAAPALLTFGTPTVLSGQVTGPDNVNVRVDLLPGNLQANTDASGNYSFTVKPQANTRYHVTAKAKPQVESAVVEVKVRPLISFGVDDSSARKGQRVKFSGSVSPAHDGLPVMIQRKVGAGAYRTIATVTLAKSAVAGRSTYARRLKVSRTATYRVRIAADADHAAGTSRTRRVRVAS
jgi:hypothetical protein